MNALNKISWILITILFILFSELNIPAQKITSYLKYALALNGKNIVLNSDGQIETLSDTVVYPICINGIEIIKKNGLYGYSDTLGNIIIPCQFEKAHPFYHGVAEVIKNKEHMIIDKHNNNLIPKGCYFYDYFDKNGELFIIEKKSMCGVIDRFGNTIIPFHYEYILPLYGNRAEVKLNGKSGYINKSGKEVIPLIYDNAFNFKYGVAKVAKNRKYGLVDTTGREIIPVICDQIIDNSRSSVKIIKNGISQELNSGGTLVTESLNPDYFPNNFAMVEKDEKWGFYSLLGKEISADYDLVEPFEYGIAKVKMGEKYGYIDTTGRVVIPIEFDDALTNLDNGLLRVKKSSKWGYINTEGKIIIPFIYEQVNENAWEKLIKEKSFFRYNFIIILGGNYTFSDFSENIVGVKKDSKWGFIDRTGKTTIPFMYDSLAGGFYQNFAFVRLGDKWGCINKNNDIVIPIIYSSICWWENMDLFMVKKEDKSGIINCFGNTVIPIEYDEINDLYGKYFLVKKNGKWGVLDYNNKTIIECLYDRSY